MVTYYGIWSSRSLWVGLQVDDADTPSTIQGADPRHSLTILSISDAGANNGIANLNDNDHVVVAATFSDDSGRAILDTHV